MDNIEIEIEVNIEHSKPLLEFLEKNAKFISKAHQIDEYFTPSHRDFLKIRPIKEWLRLRNSDNKYSINYKNWHPDQNGKTHYCDEYETKIENLDTAKKILQVLDFKPIVTVNKIRKTWLYKEYEIALDSVKNLGNFVEIEYKGNDEKADPAKITQDMISFLKNLNCGDIKRNFRGYPFILLFPDEVKYESQ